MILQQALCLFVHFRNSSFSLARFPQRDLISFVSSFPPLPFDLVILEKRDPELIGRIHNSPPPQSLQSGLPPRSRPQASKPGLHLKAPRKRKRIARTGFSDRQNSRHHDYATLDIAQRAALKLNIYGIGQAFLSHYLVAVLC